MGFGVVLLFAAIIILALGIKGTYQHLPPWRKGGGEDRWPGIKSKNNSVDNAVNLAQELQQL